MKFLYMAACLAILAVNIGALVKRDTAQEIVDRVISETKDVEKREVEKDRPNIGDEDFKNVESLRDLTDSTKIKRAAHDCPNSFTYIPALNKCYQLVNNKMPWENARKNCKTFHPKSRLLVIKDQREQNSIVSSFLNPRKGTIDRDCKIKHRVYNAYYAGLWTAGQRVTTSPQSNDWVWKPDAWFTMGYTAWLPGEPNNFRNEESCMVLMHGQFGWNDDECQVNHCSICEVELN